MTGAGRVVAGTAIAVAATFILVLALFLTLHGHDGGPLAVGPAGAGGQAPQGGPAAPPASSSAASAASPGATPARAIAHGDGPLSGAAAAYVAGRAGTVLAAVYDVRTGQSWRLGAGAAQDEASVVKLNVLEALLARQGGASLAPADQALAQAMIEDSDNDSATSLWRAAGGAAGIRAFNERAGLAGTTPSPCVACAGFDWPGWGLTTTVPQDQVTLLKHLVVPGPHPLLSAAQRSYALSLMEHVRPDQAWGVSAGVPAGVRVALKNGWLPLDHGNTNWQVNSVGWVSGAGRDYLVAVLAAGNPSEQYGIDTINGLSSRIWSAMG
jgi:hypothetical protein